MSRFDKVRGFQYNLAETLFTVTSTALEMPYKKLKQFPGSNRNNVLGPIACLPYNDENHHMLQWREKKNIWSAAAKVSCRVGGQGEEGVTRGRERRPETTEPVCFHGYSREVWAELLHMHSAIGFIDLTVGPAYAAEACIANRVPYIGFVQTGVHETVTRRYLFKRMWELMQKPGSAHYEPELAMLLNNKGKGGGAPSPDKTPARAGGGAARANFDPLVARRSLIATEKHNSHSILVSALP